jgi:hypothetical protein
MNAFSGMPVALQRRRPGDYQLFSETMVALQKLLIFCVSS